MDKRLTTIVALVVTGVWALSFIADIFVANYDPSPFIHLAMMAIVGALFGKSFLTSNLPDDNKKDKDEN